MVSDPADNQVPGPLRASWSEVADDQIDAFVGEALVEDRQAPAPQPPLHILGGSTVELIEQAEGGASFPRTPPIEVDHLAALAAELAASSALDDVLLPDALEPMAPIVDARERGVMSVTPPPPVQEGEQESEVDAALRRLFETLDQAPDDDDEDAIPLPEIFDLSLTADTVQDAPIPPGLAELLVTQEAGIKIDDALFDSLLDSNFGDPSEPATARARRPLLGDDTEPRVGAVVGAAGESLDANSTYIQIKRLGASSETEFHLVCRMLPDRSARACVLARLHPQRGLNWKVRRARFLAEREIASTLSHPNFAATLDVGEHEERPFYVRTFVSGASVKQLLQAANGPLPVAIAIEIARQIARALSFIHNVKDGRGGPLYLVHGELSPSEIYVSLDGVAKLGQVGLTRLGDRNLRGANGGRRGHPHYAAPEQRQGWPIDERADLFSLGIILAEMLTNKPLLKGHVRLDQLESEIRAGCVERGGIPPRLIDLITQLTKAVPDARPRTATEVETVFDEILAQIAGPPDLKAELAPLFAKQTPVVSVPAAEVPTVGAPIVRPSQSLPVQPPQPSRPFGAAIALAVGTAIVLAIIWFITRR